MRLQSEMPLKKGQSMSLRTGCSNLPASIGWICIFWRNILPHYEAFQTADGTVSLDVDADSSNHTKVERTRDFGLQLYHLARQDVTRHPISAQNCCCGRPLLRIYIQTR